MTNYNIKINSQYNSTEIFFEGKPEEATRNILKANGFKWSPIQSCWYGFADPDQITAALEGTTAPVKEVKKAAEVINTGWDIEKALTIPPSRVNGKQGKRRNKKTYLIAETEKISKNA